MPNSLTPRLFVVDDDRAVLGLVVRVARGLGFAVDTTGDGRDALDAILRLKPDAAVIDLRLPHISGLDILRAVRTADPTIQVILITGDASLETAAEAIQAGALEYLSKPFDIERLKAALITVRESISRRERFLSVDAELARQIDFHGMVGRSPAMQDLFDGIRRLAPHARQVLVSGETGTGKELVAHAFHQIGPRRDRRFVIVNCSAIVETLFESELFGAVKGAYTGAVASRAGLFETADGGTLFLDEIGELPIGMQSKLLRAVEHGEVQRVGDVDTRRVDVRVVAATNRDLQREADDGRFRADLYFRLSTIALRVPPLRDRPEDIPYLTAVFMREMSERMGRAPRGITAGAERMLVRARWPGNVRELRSVLERACLLTDGHLLSERQLALAWAAGSAPAPASPGADERAAPPAAPPEPDQRLETVERAQIERVLRETGGNKALAARQLGMSRRTLYRWLERFKRG